MRLRFLPDARYCYTRHMMDNHGDSVSVTKRCVILEDCLFTGCAGVTDNGYQVCGSSGLNCIKVHSLILISWKTEKSQIFFYAIWTSSQHLSLVRQVCSSCCEGNICNVLVPRNESGAIFSSTSPLVSSSGGLLPAALSYIIIIIIFIFTAGHVWVGKLCICATSTKTSW